MKQFDIPVYYKSSFIAKVKEARKITDPRKKDLTPTVLDFGPVRFFIARHFGFCYGVENAIEIAYKALGENPDKRIFLLSQMIHNPEVNKDLQERGMRFIMDTEGNQLIDWTELQKDDIVIVPAFGTTVEIEERLGKMGIEIQRYNTTCPFVEKVWKRSAKLGEDQFTIIIHGKHRHEETRATFSHSRKHAASVVIKDMEEAKLLGEIISGSMDKKEFYRLFENRYSSGFNVEIHLERVGVVNQTTMLASETHAIAEYFKESMIKKYGAENQQAHFADTRDTLCYATNDNQSATYSLLERDADIAIVVGGYNSSNTSHIVELCEQRFPSYFIAGPQELISSDQIRHYNIHQKKMLETDRFLPAKAPVNIILTSGASCPDTVVEQVLDKILSFFKGVKSKEEVLNEMI